MSEELLQRDLLKNPNKIGKWDFYSIGATSIKALKEHGIIRNIDYKDVEKKKVDGIIVLRKFVIAVIEYKNTSEFRTKAQQDKAIKQEINVAKAIGSKLIIATDTKETVWVNVATGERIKDENGNEIKTNFDPNDERLPNLIEKINFSINEKNNQLKPKKLVNPTDLAKQIWQDIWSVSGATPENCLYTFVELFIFKYLSDLDVLKGSHNFYSLIKMYNDNTDDEVLEHYADSIRKKIKDLFPYNPIDSTTIINGTIFVSKDQKAVAGYSVVFRKVLNRFNDYGKLEHIDYDFKSQLFESFLKESISKKNWGQFFTPIKVVRAIVEMSKDDIKSGIKICDPACGVGKFLLEPLITRLDEFFDISNGTIKDKITIHGFDKGFDKDEQKTIILAKANMLIYFSDLIKENTGITKQFSDLFNKSFTLKTNSILGTLSDPIENEYDLILTNPPYVSSGSSNLKEEISKDGDLKPYYKINALGVEGLFMEWIIRALKPSGKAFVVIPDGILTRQNDKNLRKFITDECIIDGLISLPTKTFFTTPKKTYILALTKKANKKEPQRSPVFTYLCSEIGESRDIYRFDIDQNDLQEAVMLYNFFKGNKSGFEKINTDKRCKIINYSFFEDNIENNWNVENNWSREEKIDLEIIEQIDFIKFNEFPDLLEDVSNNIITLKQEILQLSDKKIFNDDIVNLSQVNSLKSFVLGDIFDFPSIKGLSASFIQKNQGSIPVYGGKKEESPVGFIKDELPNVKYFSNCLAWNREGSVGFVFWHKHKFTTNDHHRPLLVKKEFEHVIDLNYMKFTLEKMLLSQGFEWSKTASKEKVTKLTVAIPVLSNGGIDLKTQQVIAANYLKVEEVKKQLLAEIGRVLEANINYD